MGLFNFLKPKMPNGVNSNDINEATGMTYYQQSMTLIAHCLMLIAQVEKRADSYAINKIAKIQLLFSTYIMQIKMDLSEIKDILFDMQASIEEMSEEESFHYSNEGITEMAMGLPRVVQKQILVYLMMYHAIDESSSKLQAEAVGHIHDMFFGDYGEDPREIMRIAMKNVNLHQL